MVNPSKWANLKSNFLKFHHRNQVILGIEKARKMAYFRAFLALLSCRLSLAELWSATSGFEANLMIALEDKPGQLTRVSEIISGMGANVVSVQYDLADPNMTVTSCFLKLGLETRDHTQIEQIKAKLTEEGFKLVSERA